MRPEAIPSKTFHIRDGVSGTADTLTLMANLIKAGKRDPIVRTFAARLVTGAGIGGGNSKNRFGEIETVYNFVREKIRYVWDIDGQETLHTPRFILQNGFGDCDDKVILAGAMLASLGHKVRVIAMGNSPGRFSHVILEVLIFTKRGPRWLPLDCTEDRGLGWAPPHISRMVRHCR